MKIHHLTLAAFGPFAGQESVDFDAFAPDGLFLIEGRTGAGKSSILDAISYALFEKAPRYDTAAPARLRSDYAGPSDHTFVELIFSTAEGRFKITRSPKYDRPAKRGGGMTPRAATAILEQHIDGEWVVLSTLARETGTRVEALVQLSADQFLQVILLAQNRFGEFLRAKSADRLALLRTLFKSLRFDHYQAAAKARADELGAGQKEAQRIEAELLAAVFSLAPAGPEPEAEAPTPATEPLPASAGSEPPSGEAAIDVLSERSEQAVAAAIAQATVAEQDHLAARAEQDRAEHLARAQERRDSALADHRALDLSATAVEADRRAVAAGERARAVDPAHARERRAEESRESALEHSVRRRALLGEAAPATPEELATRAEELSELLGSLAPILVQEQEVPAWEKDLLAAQTALRAAQEAVESETARQLSLPAQLRELRDLRDQAQLLAATIEPARERLTRAQERQQAVVDLVAADAALAQADTARRRADHAHSAAAEAHRSLLAAQLAGIAGTLAAELHDHEPCPVCGSENHPAPAPLSAETVSAEAVEAAGAEVERAAALLATAGNAASSAVLHRTVILERAQGRDAEAALRDTEQAEQTVVQAETAENDAALHSAAIIEAEAVIAAGEARLARGKSELSDAEHRAQEAASGLSALRERLDQHRGEASTVAQCSRDTRELRDAVIAAREADFALAGAETELLAAQQERSEALQTQGFTGEDALLTYHAARIPDEQFRLTQERIADHERRTAGVMARLSEPDLADLPTEPVPLSGVREAAERAGARRDAALGDRSAEQRRHDSLIAAIQELRSERESAGQARAERERWAALSDALAGGETNTRRTSLESYVLAAELTKIVREANTRLTEMTAGRYELRHDDSLARRNAKSGLGLRIYDGHTGRERDTETLSGGETFLASLALALGLAEVVTQGAGGVRLDTLFIDEGFGSLDAQTLDVAVATLDSLRSGGRTVGVISHVPALQERIPSRLRVRALPSGGSTIDHGREELPDR